MNRLTTSIISVALVVLLVLVGVGWYVSRPSQPANPAPPTTGGGTSPINTYTVSNGITSGSQNATQSVDAVRAAFSTKLANQNPDNIKPQSTAVAGDWALQEWQGTYSGGEALLHYDAGAGQWSVLDNGGGLWGVAGLMKFGMTKTTALILLGGMKQLQ